MVNVFKFGGALMKEADGFRKIADIVRKHHNQPLIVVVSAMGKTTNALEELIRLTLAKKHQESEELFVTIRRQHFEMAEALFDNAKNGVFDRLDELFILLLNELKDPPKSRYAFYDQVVCFGELLSSALVNAFLIQSGLPVHLVDAHTLLVTNSNYTSASINWKLSQKTIESRISPLLEQGKIVLTQGFIGADLKGMFTTLGREGSDFTAAVLANILDGAEVSIWKDVPGLMNADPKRFSDTIKLNHISYHEAIELAFYGASVVHPKTIQPVQHKNIPLKVRSFYQPDTQPTVISEENREDDLVPKIIVKPDQLLLSIGSRDLAFIAEEHLKAIFDAFSKHKIHVNLMQHSAVSFSVCFNEDMDKLEALKNMLQKDFTVKYNRGLTLITIRHYSEELAEKMIQGKKVYLEQKSRTTMQVLVS